jgi:integral membrane protein
MLSTRIGRLRLISVLEGISYLVLLLISRWVLDWHPGVAVLGPIHGILFITYLLGVLDLRKRMNWDTATLVKLLAAAVIPFATFFVERWLRDQHEPARQAG